MSTRSTGTIPTIKKFTSGLKSQLEAPQAPKPLGFQTAIKKIK